MKLRKIGKRCVAVALSLGIVVSQMNVGSQMMYAEETANQKYANAVLKDGIYYEISSVTENGVTKELATVVGDDGTVTSVAIAAEINGVPVTAIEEYAFSEYGVLEKVELPASVKTIGKAAFLNNHSLESVNVPDGVSVLEEFVFSGCYALNWITIPDSVKTIKASAFSNCFHSSAAKIPSTVTSIEDEAFDSYAGIIGQDNSEAHRYAMDNGNQFYYYEGNLNYFVTTETNVSGEAVACVRLFSIDGDAVSATIPKTIAGYPVLSIDGSCFRYCQQLESLTVDLKDVSMTNHSANYLNVSNCAALKKLTFTDPECAVTGVNLSNTAIEDVDGIASLKNIRTLYLDHTTVKDLSAIENRKDIYFVSIDGVKTLDAYIATWAPETLHVLPGDSLSLWASSIEKVSVYEDGYEIEVPEEAKEVLDADLNYSNVTVKALKPGKAVIYIIMIVEEQRYKIPVTIEVGEWNTIPEVSEEKDVDADIIFAGNTAGILDATGELWKLEASGDAFFVEEQVSNVKSYVADTIYLSEYDETKKDSMIEDSGNIGYNPDVVLDKDDTLYVNGVKTLENVAKFDSFYALTKSGELIYHYNGAVEKVTDVKDYVTSIGNIEDGQWKRLTGVLIWKNDGSLWYRAHTDENVEYENLLAENVVEIYEGGYEYENAGGMLIGYLTEDGGYYKIVDGFPTLILDNVKDVVACNVLVRKDGTTWAWSNLNREMYQILDCPVKEVKPLNTMPLYTLPHGYCSVGYYLYMDENGGIWSCTEDREIIYNPDTNSTTTEITSSSIKLCEEGSRGFTEYGYLDKDGVEYDCNGLPLDKVNLTWYLDADHNLYHNGALIMTGVQTFTGNYYKLVIVRTDGTLWQFSTNTELTPEQRLFEIKLMPGEDSGTTNVPSALKGNLNDDQVVDLQDAQIALKMALGIGTWDNALMSAGDIDGTPGVGLADALMILKMALGIPV